MKAAHFFEPHLAINQLVVPPAAEWIPQLRGWLFLQINKGIGYWRQPKALRELGPDSVLILTGQPGGGNFRASQIGEVVINYFTLEHEKLSGLLSLSEQHALRRAALRESLSFRQLAPDDPISARFKTLCAGKNGGNFFLRLQLLQLFIDLFKCELNEPSAEPALELDGRGRLRQLLKQMAATEFLELSLSDLAPKMNCSPRHLSRLFRQELGVSFREKQTEIRLAKACQLLSTTKERMIDIALASGYQSNSLFNIIFKRHLGMTPGQWRAQQNRKARPRQKVVRMLSV
ncbi:MAG TPA: AraC family transcriptional regulator [Verrucomicrobiae bacterium]|jgi:AraC-like DNA-binding protein|nr:AraC family transcriptional regulator [Verrucomicrobiae bacterium]